MPPVPPPPVPPPPVPPPPVPPPPTRQKAPGVSAQHLLIAGVCAIAILAFLAGLGAYATHVERRHEVAAPIGLTHDVISNAPPTTSSHATPPAKASGLEAQSTPKFLEVLVVGSGETVSVGDKADDVFPLVQRYETGDPITADDPWVPGSLFVIHTYKIRQTIYALGFGRVDADGPYRLSTIREE